LSLLRNKVEPRLWDSPPLNVLDPSGDLGLDLH
jgi:hypothetical protein